MIHKMPEHTPSPTPARSIYGFFLYLFSTALSIIYCIWAFVPERYLHYFHIYYYPLKYWAYSIPIQCLVALKIFTFFIYPSINLTLTANTDSVDTITDPNAHFYSERSESYHNIADFCICEDKSKCFKDCHVISERELHDKKMPPLEDLDIRMVCKNLYLKKQFY